MEYMGDADYWNQKFEKRPLCIAEAEKLLVQDAKNLPFNGSGLELACGDGRNLIWLAKQGYSMTGVDFSEAALKRLEKFSQENNIPIKADRMDLSEKNCLALFSEFDFIIINHYRLCPDFYPELMDHVVPGGYLWVNGFCGLPEDNPDITSADLLREEDFEGIFEKIYDIKYYEEGGKKFARYCLKK